MNLPEAPSQTIEQVFEAMPRGIFNESFPLQFFKIANNTATLVDEQYQGIEGDLVFSIVNNDGWISINKVFPK